MPILPPEMREKIGKKNSAGDPALKVVLAVISHVLKRLRRLIRQA